jgi:hypothetical protein
MSQRKQLFIQPNDVLSCTGLHAYVGKQPTKAFVGALRDVRDIDVHPHYGCHAANRRMLYSVVNRTSLANPRQDLTFSPTCKLNQDHLPDIRGDEERGIAKEKRDDKYCKADVVFLEERRFLVFGINLAIVTSNETLVALLHVSKRHFRRLRCVQVDAQSLQTINFSNPGHFGLDFRNY